MTAVAKAVETPLAKQVSVPPGAASLLVISSSHKDPVFPIATNVHIQNNKPSSSTCVCCGSTSRLWVVWMSQHLPRVRALRFSSSSFSSSSWMPQHLPHVRTPRFSSSSSSSWMSQHLSVRLIFRPLPLSLPLSPPLPLPLPLLPPPPTSVSSSFSAFLRFIFILHHSLSLLSAWDFT